MTRLPLGHNKLPKLMDWSVYLGPVYFSPGESQTLTVRPIAGRFFRSERIENLGDADDLQLEGLYLGTRLQPLQYPLVLRDEGVKLQIDDCGFDVAMSFVVKNTGKERRRLSLRVVGKAVY